MQLTSFLLGALLAGTAMVPAVAATQAGSFSLDLDWNELTANEVPAFDLGLDTVLLIEPDLQTVIVRGVPTAPLAPTNNGGELELEATSLISLNSDPEERRRLEFAATQVERAIHEEEAHLREGGLVGLSESTVLMFDVIVIARYIAKAYRAVQERRRSPAERLAMDRDLTFVVRELDGTCPSEISVLPIVLGRVANALHASCDEAGRCHVVGLPEEPCTVLVRAEGAALVRLDLHGGVLGLRLKPTGRLPINGESMCANLECEVRIVDDRGYPVPVGAQLNPGRGVWWPSLAVPLSVPLPVGRYRIETRDPRSKQMAAAFDVELK